MSVGFFFTNLPGYFEKVARFMDLTEGVHMGLTSTEMYIKLEGRAFWREIARRCSWRDIDSKDVLKGRVAVLMTAITPMLVRREPSSGFGVNARYSIDQFQKGRVARDTLFVWDALAQAIEVEPPPLEGHSSISALIESANSGFVQWCVRHADALSRIKFLSLENLELTSLPIQLAMLSNLETLELSENQLQTVPPVIFQLANLKDLRLCANFIQQLSSDLQYLYKLEVLSIIDNLIQELPSEVLFLEAIFDIEADEGVPIPPVVSERIMTNKAAVQA